jgi:UDP-galactopyranose mutase
MTNNSQGPNIQDADVLVVGAGLFGLTMAQQIAEKTTKKVSIIEKRDVVGGNAYSYFDEQTNIEVHKFGTHLFHTSNERVWDYVNRFTEFTNYEHKVFTKHHGVIYSMPINLHTLSQFYNRDISPQIARESISTANKKAKNEFQSFEDKAIASVGVEIYEAFFKNYTSKQWQIPPSELPSEIFTRLPVRFNLDNAYFDDKYQGLPTGGYHKWFLEMIDTPNITVHLNSDFFLIKDRLDLSDKLIIYTGPIDRYFNYRYGELSWRTLEFDFETLPIEDFQGTSVMNYADNPPLFTRIHEFKHLHPERKYTTSQTIIAREYSRKAQRNEEPYYPINSVHDREVLAQYRKDAAEETQVVFGGRLGTYQYLDMHMAIASALTLFDNEILPRLNGGGE